MTKNQRLNAQITIGSVLEQSVRQNIGFLKTGLSQIGNEIKTVERRQKELDRQRNVLRRQGQSVEALDREYEELGRTLDSLRRKQERWNRAAGASRRVGQTFTAAAADIRSGARTIALGVTVAGGAIFGLANSTATLGDNAAKTADKLGIGIQPLQELRYAAERAGVSTDTFDSSLEKMVRNIGLAIEGTGAQADALEKLGLSADELARMAPEDALGAIADRMVLLETQAERAAVATDLFGRSGVGMINMLRDGSDGLEQLREQAQRTGYVLSDEAARDGEVFQDVLLDLQLTAKGLKNTFGAELVPVVTRAMTAMTEHMLENREEAQIWAENVAGGVERAIPLIGEFATGMGTVLSITAEMTTSVAGLVGGWENFGLIVGTVLASKTILSVGKFAGSVFSLGRAMVALGPALPVVAGGIKAIGLALVANPIGVAVAAIAAGATLLITNWEKVGPFMTSLLDRVGAAFQTVLEYIRPVVDMLKWTRDNGTAAVGAIRDTLGLGAGSVMDNLDGATASRGGTTDDPGGTSTAPSAGLDALRQRNAQVNGSAARLSDFLAPSGGAGGSGVTQNITNNYNADGVSARELMDMADRNNTQQARSSLFDPASPSGR